VRTDEQPPAALERPTSEHIQRRVDGGMPSEVFESRPKPRASFEVRRRPRNPVDASVRPAADRRQSGQVVQQPVGVDVDGPRH